MRDIKLPSQAMPVVYPFLALRKGKGSAFSLAFSPDGSLVATGNVFNEKVQLWEFPSGRFHRTLITNCEIAMVAFSPDGHWLAAGCWCEDVPVGKLLLWNLHTDQAPVILTQHLIAAVAFSPDSRTLAAGVGLCRPAVLLWDIPTAKQQARLRLPLLAQASFLAFSPDGRTLASASNGTVVLWDTETGQVQFTLRHAKSWWNGNLPFMLAFSGDGTVLATAGSKFVKLWDTATGSERASFRMDLRGFFRITFAMGDQLWLIFQPWTRFHPVTGQWIRGSLLFRSLGDVEQMKPWDPSLSADDWWLLEAKSPDEPAVAFSPDYRTLAAAGKDGLIRFWKVPLTT
jgi:WD40 repeat protein